MSNFGPQKIPHQQIVHDLIKIAKDHDANRRTSNIDNFISKNRKNIINAYEPIITAIQDYCLEIDIPYINICDELNQCEVNGVNKIFMEKMKESEDEFLVGYQKVNLWYLFLTKILPLQKQRKRVTLENDPKKNAIYNMLIDLIPATYYLIERFCNGKLLVNDYYTCYKLIFEKCTWISEYGLDAQDYYIKLFKQAKSPHEKNYYIGNIQLLLISYKQVLAFLTCYCEDHLLVLDQSLKFSKTLLKLAPDIDKLQNNKFTSKDIQVHNDFFENVAAGKVIRPMWIAIFNSVNKFYNNDWQKDADIQDFNFTVFHETTSSLMNQMSPLNLANVESQLTITGIELINVSNTLTMLKTYKGIHDTVPNYKEVLNDVLKVMYTFYAYINFPVDPSQKCIIYCTQTIIKQMTQQILEKLIAFNTVQDKTNLANTNHHASLALEKKEIPIIVELNTDLVVHQDLSALLNIDDTFCDQIIDAFSEFSLEIEEKSENYLNPAIIQEESPNEILEPDDIDNIQESEIKELTDNNEKELYQLTLTLDETATKYKNEKQDEFEAKKISLIEAHKKAIQLCNKTHKNTIKNYKKQYQKLSNKLDQEKEENTNTLNILTANNQASIEKLRDKIQEKKTLYARECTEYQANLDNEVIRHNSEITKLKLAHQDILNKIEQQRQQYNTQINNQIAHNKKEEDALQKKLKEEQVKKLNSITRAFNVRSSALNKRHDSTLNKIKEQDENTLNQECTLLQNKLEPNKRCITYAGITNLNPIETICIPDDVELILQLLQECEHYIFGGYVRDCLLKLPMHIIKSNDIDVMVNCDQKDLPLLIKNISKPTAIPYLIRVGRIDLVCKRWDNLETELQKLDFKINTFICSKNKVYDVLGAKADLNNAYLVPMEDASKYFQENPINILRLLRLTIKLRKQIDPKDFLTIQELSYLIPQRVPMGIYLNNLKKLFAHYRSVEYYEKINKWGMLCHIIPTIPQDYKQHLKSTLNLGQFWKKKMHDMANATEELNGYYVLSLFLIMPLLLKENNGKDLDLNVEKVINKFLEKTTAFSNEDKTLLRRSVTSILIGNRDVPGMYTQYKTFESRHSSTKLSISSCTHNREEYSNIYTPSFDSSSTGFLNQTNDTHGNSTPKPPASTLRLKD